MCNKTYLLDRHSAALFVLTPALLKVMANQEIEPQDALISQKIFAQEKRT